MPQIETRSLENTGWVVPAGWYGFVPAAGIGIIDRAKVPHEKGYAALEKLGSPESGSRSQEFEGRRLVRIDGGYLVLNYMKYRERDYTTAERSARYRARLKAKASLRDVTTPHRDITQAEEEVDAEVEAKSREIPKDKIKPIRASRSVVDADFNRFWALYPKKKSKGSALKAWAQMQPPIDAIVSALGWQVNQPGWKKDGGQFIPFPATWLRARGWEDEPFHAPAAETTEQQLARIRAGGGRMPT